MYTPTSSKGKGSVDSEHADLPDSTDSESLERTNAATTRREISPCSVTTPSTLDQLYTPSVSEKILSRCCCMFEEIQSELRRVPGNATCCDCGAPEPQWASVTLASLVCIRCAGSHRALGVKKSRIRSLQMDSWSRSQVLRMLMGGNSRLKHAFVVAGQSFETLDVSTRYNGPVAVEYVATLNARCPPATPCTPTPKMFQEDIELSPLPELKRRVTPLSRHAASPLDSRDESHLNVSTPQLHSGTPTHRVYCPCSSSPRWTHLPSIAGEQRNMPILCSGGTTRIEENNCIVSSFDKFRLAVLRMCGDRNFRSVLY